MSIDDFYLAGDFSSPGKNTRFESPIERIERREAPRDSRGVRRPGKKFWGGVKTVENGKKRGKKGKKGGKKGKKGEKGPRRPQYCSREMEARKHLLVQGIISAQCSEYQSEEIQPSPVSK